MEPPGKESPKTPTAYPDVRLSHPCIAPHSSPISCSRLWYVPPGRVGPPCFAWILAHCLAVRKPSPGRESCGDQEAHLTSFASFRIISCAACCLHLENSNLPYFSQPCLWREGSSARITLSELEAAPGAPWPAADGLMSRLAAQLLPWDLPWPPSWGSLCLSFEWTSLFSGSHILFLVDCFS